MNKDTKQRLFEMMNKVGGMPILTEIDWEDEFSDVSKECISIEALKEYFNKVLKNQKQPSDKRTKPSLMIHNKSIPFDDSGEIDVNTFIKNITEYPPQIISQNEKMNKSGGESSITFNIGLPALRGLVYDIQNQEFYIVNTCPGAGACAAVCYARRGRYAFIPAISQKQTRILNLLLNNPNDFKKQLFREIEVIAMKNKGKRLFFRWNDAGDFFTKKYFQIAVEITKELKESGFDFESYAHTKMGDVYNLNDPDVILNFSVDASEKEKNKVNLTTAKTSEIVPSNLFKDLFVRDKAHFAVNAEGKLIPKDENSISTLKQRISNEFNVDLNYLLMYDELIKMPEENTKKYNVIVLPKGQGDIAAQRRDVQRTFLLYH
jgi:hypothetical protein